MRALRQAITNRFNLESLRMDAARTDSLVPLSMLALLAGLLTGLVIVLFRLFTERTLVWIGFMNDAENFEALSWQWRLGLPVAGGLLIGLLFHWAPAAMRQVGPIHVMTRLAYHGGRLPLINALVQFVSASIAIMSGHSVGREGPVIHMGATSASLLGQWMRLPNNSIRTLVSAGIAAAIAASFNTPIAGVVFAMEVVMFEYTLVGFAPIIIAAVSATTVSRLVFGEAPAIFVPSFQLGSLLELPWVVFLGLVISCLGAAYVYGVTTVERRSASIPIWARITLAGLVTGLVALVVPEVMGLGYDTAQGAMIGKFELLALITIAIAKLGTTIACGGLGVPAGLIGPMVVIGATAGGALGNIGGMMVDTSVSSPAFYATLGVVAMMGACLHAPLAAIMAILELTANPNTILPGMVAVITAFLMSRIIFRQEPLFIAILSLRGVDYRFDPIALALERTGVRAVMSRRFMAIEAEVAEFERVQSLDNQPDWVMLAEGRDILAVWSASEFAKLETRAPAPEAETEGETEDAEIAAPVANLPVEGPPFTTVSLHATLREALAQLDKAKANIVLVADTGMPRRHMIRGIISREQIESTVRYRA